MQDWARVSPIKGKIIDRLTKKLEYKPDSIFLHNVSSAVFTHEDLCRCALLGFRDFMWADKRITYLVGIELRKHPRHRRLQLEEPQANFKV
jgi:hypothetical protein